MAKGGFFWLQCLLAVLVLSTKKILCTAQDEDRKVYIVYMGSLPTMTSATESLTSHHLRLLQQVIGLLSSASASASLVRSYTRSFNGFAAKLTQKEAEKLASNEEVFSVFPSRTFHIQTTRSWDFIGLPRTAKRKPAIEGNIIIGVVDTGADPESKSFSDEGFGPPPKRWKGSCNGGANFTCNNKLIGARYYLHSEESALDSSGHGTHTASTAAGNEVDGASFFRLANGTARGGVPSSRIAVYKVCVPGCSGDAILAAFDDAIADGVDIITISLSSVDADSFDEDPIAIGSFHAMAKGLVVTHSAGNRGPDEQTVGNEPPWLISVAASTIDRRFISKLVLGDGTVLTGPAVNGFPSLQDNSALVVGKQITNSCDEDHAKICFPGCLERKKVAGKIVICDIIIDASEAAVNGARGIIQRAKSPDVAGSHALPFVALDGSSFEKLLSYHNSTKDPQGRILEGETAPNPDSPVIASYSSRGPNRITPDIMKPDVSAPGTYILAAYPPKVPPAEEKADDRSVPFNILSGTSMSCPHVAGAAAYVKEFHPDWSPSAIKSALMTTASKLRGGEKTGYEYSYGSGQINPTKAVDPGLVYEITKDDYLKFICSLNFDVRKLDSNSSCPKGARNITAAELNYPSLSFQVPVSKPFQLSLNRTVTNVGPPNSTYKAKVSSSTNINITVVPGVLSFKSVSEKKSFAVKIAGSNLKSGTRLSYEVVWSDGMRNVRSPIIVYTGERSTDDLLAS